MPTVDLGLERTVWCLSQFPNVGGLSDGLGSLQVALAALPSGAEYPMEMPTTLTKPLY